MDASDGRNNSPGMKMNQEFSMLMNKLSNGKIIFFFLFGAIFFIKKDNRAIVILILYGFRVINAIPSLTWYAAF